MRYRILYICLYLIIEHSCSYSQASLLRIVHFNMGHLSMGKKSKPSIMIGQRSRVVLSFETLINDISPDILCLCEYPPYFSIKANGILDTEDITRKAIFPQYKYLVKTMKEGMNCNAIVSKDIDVRNHDVVAYSMRKQKRTYIVSTIVLNGEKVYIVETHLDVPRYKEQRAAQIRELIGAFEKADKVIICGDFNVSSLSEYDIFKNHGYMLANHGKFGDIVTFPWKKKESCIDNIICKGFDIKSIQVYDTGLSDHYAIACDVVMKK